MLESIEFLKPEYITMTLIGVGILSLSAFFHRFDGKPFSFPILIVLLGYLTFSLPYDLEVPNLYNENSLILYLSKLGVIISLMGVGLKVGELPSLRKWEITWRLLLICMPLTILLISILGYYYLGIGVASAVLLGAVLAPTDPVLASDIQIGIEKYESKSRTTMEKMKFALSTEAGLNDALAFPFVWLAVKLQQNGLSNFNWSNWIGTDVIYRIVLGVIVGYALGKVAAKILLSLPVDSLRNRVRVGAGALATTLLLYAIAELIGGYGFLSTFIGAIVIRLGESKSQAHLALHSISEQTEQILMTVMLIYFGGLIASGLFNNLSYTYYLVALAIVLVVRPLTGMISLIGEKELKLKEKLLVSFFGVRGVGSVYYLTFAIASANFTTKDELWLTVSLVIIMSILIHGVTSGWSLKSCSREEEC